MQRAFAIGPVEQATMIRLDVAAHAHRDAVRFANGREVLLQCLNAGVTAELAARDLEEILGLAAVPALADV